MTKINTKNLICCRVELETLDNISKAINALQLVELTSSIITTSYQKLLDTLKIT